MKAGSLASALLDASLDALAHDFAQFRAGWFSRFHDLLEPTSDEQWARRERYLALLGSSVPTTVSWALRIVDKIDKHEPLPAGGLIESLKPAVEARAKGTVAAALKLLLRIRKRDPDSRSAAALAATTALAHESSEVQSAAIDLLEQFGDLTDEALWRSVARYGSAVSPSVRPRLEKLITGREAGVVVRPEKAADLSKAKANLAMRIAAVPQELAELAGVPGAWASLEDGRLGLAALSFDGTEIPRLDPMKAVRPIADIDELIDVSAAVIEGRGEIDEIERVLDGISRLCDRRPADFAKRTGPLVKRALDIERRAKRPYSGMTPFIGIGPEHDIRGTIQAWLTDQLPAPETPRAFDTCCYEIGEKTLRFAVRKWDAVQGCFSRRAYEVAARSVARKPHGLLSASDALRRMD